MRHLKAGRKLGRNATHRLALMRNLARALFEHERIITTVPKAKALRPFVEKLITLARKNTLHARRLVLARLGPMGKTRLYDKDDEPTDDLVITKLFNEIAPRFLDRPGGYTRIIKRHERRLGDAGPTAFVELLKAGEIKVRARTPMPRPAPAPRVEEPEPVAQPSTPPPAESSPSPERSPVS